MSYVLFHLGGFYDTTEWQSQIQSSVFKMIFYL